MALFCDVALPVPLDQTFTYRIRKANADEPGNDPLVGGHVIVPFRKTKLIGIVTRLHDDVPPMDTKLVETVLDELPILTAQLMELGAWIARYYLAPLGEVLRTMLPLMAEERRHFLYRITEIGQSILFAGSQQGSSRRSRRTPEDQNVEYSVLDYLSGGASVKGTVLRRAARATPELLGNMVRKKWLERAAEVETRDAQRRSRHAVLVEHPRSPKLNENQLSILAELAGAGGSLPVAELRRLNFSLSKLQTLVKRGLIRFEDRRVEFQFCAFQARGRATC